jgi:transcriptional regulator GlxA family with amidase domain
VKLALGIFIFDDLEELDAVGPYEVFAAAAGMRAGFLDVFLVAETTQPVRCVNGMRIVPHYSFVTAPPIDILLIPGGVGTRAQAGRSQVIAWIGKTAAAARWVASVCSGARLTLATGLAAGKRITTHWSVIDELRRDGRAAEVLDNVRFVRDGNLVSAAGVSAGIDMALWLVGQLADPAFAREVQKYIEYYPAPPYTHET